MYCVVRIHQEVRAGARIPLDPIDLFQSRLRVSRQREVVGCPFVHSPIYLHQSGDRTRELIPIVETIITRSNGLLLANSCFQSSPLRLSDRIISGRLLRQLVLTQRMHVNLWYTLRAQLVALYAVCVNEPKHVPEWVFQYPGVPYLVYSPRSVFLGLKEM